MNITKHIWDIIVISALLLIALSIFGVSMLTREAGNMAVVEIDGTVIAEYPLSVDGTFSLNGGTNTLVIENGAAYLSYSNCPDHSCENMGKIHYVGQTIVCLPNHLSVTVKGEVTDGGVDIIS